MAWFRRGFQLKYRTVKDQINILKLKFNVIVRK